MWKSFLWPWIAKEKERIWQPFLASSVREGTSDLVHSHACETIAMCNNAHRVYMDMFKFPTAVGFNLWVTGESRMQTSRNPDGTVEPATA